MIHVSHMFSENKTLSNPHLKKKEMQFAEPPV